MQGRIPFLVDLHPLFDTTRVVTQMYHQRNEAAGKNAARRNCNNKKHKILRKNLNDDDKLNTELAAFLSLSLYTNNLQLKY